MKRVLKCSWNALTNFAKSVFHISEYWFWEVIWTKTFQQLIGYLILKIKFYLHIYYLKFIMYVFITFIIYLDNWGGCLKILNPIHFHKSDQMTDFFWILSWLDWKLLSTPPIYRENSRGKRGIYISVWYLIK